MNIIVNDSFNPFTYKELMEPVNDYITAYKETEGQLSELEQLTEAWRDKASRENSPEAYAMYKSYSDQLNAVVDSFNSGMNARNRGQILNMRARYASEIEPIKQASEALTKANDFRDQLGPDAIFEVNRYNSIDQFLHGQTANNKYESRKDIVARTQALSQAAAQSIFEDPIIKESVNPQFLEQIQKQGLGGLDALQQAISGNAEATNRFMKIKNQVIDELGGLDRFDSYGKRAVDSAINEGMYSGLDKYATQLVQNGEYINAAQRSSLSQQQQALQLQRDEFEYKKSQDLGTLIETDKDGNKLYRNSSGEVKQLSPETVTVTDKNKAYIARYLDINPDSLELGKTYYIYENSKGKKYIGTKPTAKFGTEGERVSLQYNNEPTLIDINPKDVKEGKLGDAIDINSGLTYDKSELSRLKRISKMDLPRNQQLALEDLLEKIKGTNAEIDLSKIKIYQAAVDGAGNILHKSSDNKWYNDNGEEVENGVRQTYIIDDL